MQSRQAIRKAIRDNPNARVVVTGCYAQTAPDDINEITGVDYVVGHDQKMAIGRMIQLQERTESVQSLSSVASATGPFQATTVPGAIGASRTRPFLKIQDGCNALCTYCIVPHARGRSRSLPIEDVLRSIRQLASDGFHEVVLTGIHLGAYGRDLTPPATLSALLHQIQDSSTMDRIRLSSIEPLELTTEIVEIVAASKIFCRHFHIPLQSGDDHILKRMGRPYSRQRFQELILDIHKRLPDAAIGADALIGFPAESDSAFQNTFDLIADLPLSYLHVFPYSARPGTPAAEMPNPVQPEVIRDRCEQMRTLSQHKRQHFYQKFVGRKIPVLIESKRDRKSGLLKGISSNYLPVLIEADNKILNTIADVEIVKLEKNNLMGVLVKT
jgi:threonylcarbamoyladenosine tRNA methylthiotransferase MtaB